MSKKTMKLLLWISLAANLFVVGAVGSFFGLEGYKDLRVVDLGSPQRVGRSSGSKPSAMITRSELRWRQVAKRVRA